MLTVTETQTLDIFFCDKNLWICEQNEYHLKVRNLPSLRQNHATNADTVTDKIIVL